MKQPKKPIWFALILAMVLALSTLTLTAAPYFTVEQGANKVGLELADLRKMPQIMGVAAYEGPQLGAEPNVKPRQIYVGVNVAKLLEKVAPVNPTDMVGVTAVDGYTKYFPASVLLGNSPLGMAIIALQAGEDSVPKWADGPQLIFLPADGLVSNEKMLAALGAKGSHYFGDKLSSTGLMVKNVSLLSVGAKAAVAAPAPAAPAAPPAAGWTLALEGVRPDKVDNGYWEQFKIHNTHYREISVTDKAGAAHVYKGMPLWMLIAIVDGSDSGHPYRFDKDLWAKGYDITLTAADGFSATFNTKDYAADSLYVCDLKDGQPLPASEGPLAVQGNVSNRKLLVSKLAMITAALAKPADEGETFLLTVKKGAESKQYTRKALESTFKLLTAPGNYTKSSGVTEGATYTGVLAADLFSAVGGALPADTIQVTAADGYKMTYPASQLLDFTDGVWCVVFKADGKYLPYDPGYFRLLKVGPTNPNIEGHLSARMVKEIEIIGSPFTNYELKIGGLMNWTIDRQTMESGVSCHNAKVEMTIKGVKSTYEGIPLWRLLAYGDDAQYAPHRQDKNVISYQAELAQKGYKVQIIAADGYTQEIDAKYLDKNQKIIIAIKKDGSYLPDGQGPLMLVWEDGIDVPANLKSVKQVKEIKLVL